MISEYKFSIYMEDGLYKTGFQRTYNGDPETPFFKETHTTLLDALYPLPSTLTHSQTFGPEVKLVNSVQHFFLYGDFENVEIFMKGLQYTGDFVSFIFTLSQDEQIPEGLEYSVILNGEEKYSGSSIEECFQAIASI